MRRTWYKLEKQRGKLGMTWKLKVQGVVVAAMVLGAVALAAAADWVDLSAWFFGF